MEADVLKLIATQGAFAILFSYLLFYVLKENSKRETNYQNIITELTSVLPTIKQDIEEIKEKVLK
ncbi:BhlA/UviB family holin-like peptide [Inconstantimicrobium mannanitabidum]|uniref:Bacteriocin UviB n=1 Tax=Inconstantimicrobium mannanitabidum TaxID=1604901 RepID=A0ACB5RIN4_9CLOT|nr:BhlA/UviB family holin-like peptide [Clostridium sp. TW13]GKX68957.1 bacteriocin UviB [Clostridium sp. TW13]